MVAGTQTNAIAFLSRTWKVQAHRCRAPAWLGLCGGKATHALQFHRRTAVEAYVLPDEVQHVDNVLVPTARVGDFISFCHFFHKNELRQKQTLPLLSVFKSQKYCREKVREKVHGICLPDTT